MIAKFQKLPYRLRALRIGFRKLSVSFYWGNKFMKVITPDYIAGESDSFRLNVGMRIGNFNRVITVLK